MPSLFTAFITLNTLPALYFTIATCIFSLEKQLQRYTFFLKQQKKYRVFRHYQKL